jgi:hypothetical protein
MVMAITTRSSAKRPSGLAEAAMKQKPLENVLVCSNKS